MYLRNHPGLDISDDLVLADGFELGQWVSQIREMWKDDVLETKYILKLEAIGFASTSEIQNWESMYWYAKDYYIENGDMHIGRNFKTKDGILLGAWIQRQKQFHFLLSDYQKEKLLCIGIEV